MTTSVPHSVFVRKLNASSHTLITSTLPSSSLGILLKALFPFWTYPCQFSMTTLSYLYSTKPQMPTTGAHNYLLHSSRHPPKCKESIPYSQLLHLRHICSSDDDFNKQADCTTGFFSHRQYPTDTIAAAAQQVSIIDRPTALQPAEKKNQDRIPLAISYHPHNLPIKNILLKHTKSLAEIHPQKKSSTSC